MASAPALDPTTLFEVIFFSNASLGLSLLRDQKQVASRREHKGGQEARGGGQVCLGGSTRLLSKALCNEALDAPHGAVRILHEGKVHPQRVVRLFKGYPQVKPSVRHPDGEA